MSDRLPEHLRVVGHCTNDKRRAPLDMIHHLLSSIDDDQEVRAVPSIPERSDA